MGFLKKLVLTTAVLTAALGYYLYRPIPDGFSSSGPVYVTYGSVHLMRTLADIGHALGLAQDYEIRRNIWHFSEQSKVTKDGSIEISNSEFDGVPVRVYSPKGKKDNSPGFVYYHGGGWTVGSVYTYDTLITKMAKALNIVFVSVDYRLAPEHIAPAAFEDCVTATKYFLKNAADFGVDPTRVGIGGDSAGGNLGATISLKLRDDKFSPRNKLQLLLYPVTQALDFDTPSYQANGDDAMLPLSDMKWYFSYYLQGRQDNADAFAANQHTTSAIKQKMAKSYMDVSKLPKDSLPAGYIPPRTDYGDEKLFNEVKDKLLDPYFSPLLVDDLSNLPKAYVLTCEYDVLRDDGVWYALRLKEAGVQVTHRHADNGFHAMFVAHDTIQEVSDYVDELVAFIKANL